jgi:hypothetical protein
VVTDEKSYRFHILHFQIHNFHKKVSPLDQGMVEMELVVVLVLWVFEVV